MADAGGGGDPTSEPTSPTSGATSAPGSPSVRSKTIYRLESPADPRHVEALTNAFPCSGVVVPQAEYRGITLRQLRKVIDHVSSYCHLWRDVHSDVALSAESLDFYQLSDWVLRPATEEEGCSFAELVMDTAQVPLWFVIHWWGESVLGCWQSLEVHNEARLDLLGDDTLDEDSPYWIYAFAARLASPSSSVEPLGDLKEEAFYHAMQRVHGALLVVSGKIEQPRVIPNPFQRIWCLLEIWTGSVHMGKLLDVAAYHCALLTDGSDAEPSKCSVSAELLTEGLSMDERRMERKRDGSGIQHKVQREEPFPTVFFEPALGLELEGSKATELSDIAVILNWFARRPDLHADPPNTHRGITKANRRIRSTLALAAWHHCVQWDRVAPPRYALALKEDRWRTLLKLDFAYSNSLDDNQLIALSEGFHGQLLEVDLRLRRCQLITNVGVSALAEAIPESLRTLRLDFKGCVRIGNAGLLQLAQKMPAGLVELFLSLEGCPYVSGEVAASLAERLPPTVRDLHFDFSGVSLLEDSVVMTIGFRLPVYLKSLHLLLAGCDLITDEAVDMIAARLPRSLQMLRLSFGNCEKLTDRSVSAIARDMPRGLLTLQVELENCRRITDWGASLLAQSLPPTLSRVAINLFGTGVHEDRHCVTRHIPTLRSWASTAVQLPPAGKGLRKEPAGYAPTARSSQLQTQSQPLSRTQSQGFSNSGSLASLFGAAAGAEAVVAPTRAASLRLPSVGLRVSRGLGDGLVVIEGDGISGQPQKKTSAKGPNRLRPLPRWKAKYEEIVQTYPRWVPAKGNVASESMFRRGQSTPELRRPVAIREPVWFP